jgi:hypothetical protein
MGDPSLRTESFSNKTEPKKMEDFIKCYELLTKDCYKIFNNSFLAEYNENYKSDYPNYGSFIMDRLGNIDYVSK